MMPVRFVVSLLVAISVLLLLAATASALRSLLIEGPTTFPLNGIWTFTGTEGRTAISCPITLVKTIVTNQMVPKIEGTLIGKVTSITANRPEARCALTGEGTFQGILILGLERTELYRVTYRSFLGTLPVPSGYRIGLGRVRIAYKVRISIIEAICLYEGELAELASIEAEQLINSFSLSGEVARVSGERICATTLEVSGAGIEPLRSVRLTLF